MSTLWRRSLYAFAFAAVIVVASSASAQGYDCGTTCDPYYSQCDQYCEVCWMFDYEGCIWWVGSTCGQSSGGCIDGNCTPNFVEVSRDT